MARWLPYHRDMHFQMLQAAVHGQYRPQFKDDGPLPERTPETVRAAANRQLDSFVPRADAAIRAYKQRKGR